MPCYLKNMSVNLQTIVKKEAERQGKAVTKVLTRAVLKDALKYGQITPAKYSQLITLVDACVEEKGHVHADEEKVRA